MAQQLTKPKAQELLKDLQYAKAQMGQLSTKEEYYKQALERLIPLWHEDEQQEPGEWIEWGGGECPISRETEVSVKFRDGETSSENHPAGSYRWYHSAQSYSRGDDIIAYRIIPEQG